jgi:hypothetical protein
MLEDHADVLALLTDLVLRRKLALSTDKSDKGTAGEAGAAKQRVLAYSAPPSPMGEPHGAEPPGSPPASYVQWQDE